MPWEGMTRLGMTPAVVGCTRDREGCTSVDKWRRGVLRPEMAWPDCAKAWHAPVQHDGNMAWCNCSMAWHVFCMAGCNPLTAWHGMALDCMLQVMQPRPACKIIPLQNHPTAKSSHCKIIPLQNHPTAKSSQPSSAHGQSSTAAAAPPSARCIWAPPGSPQSAAPVMKVQEL